MRVLVTGATGYVGGRLVPELVAAGHEVVCLARTPEKLRGRPWRDDVEVAGGDVGDRASTAAALEGCDAAYYLVHSMDGQGAFAERDRRMAEAFRGACDDAGVARVLYLGGLGRAGPSALSEHLRSRHEVGRLLADGDVAVDELRAAVVIGSGSASFEMLRNLVEVLPVMVTPTWVSTRCQPISIRDVLHYLVELLDTPPDGHRILDVGGPDVMTYREMMDLYAEVAGLRERIVVPTPFLSPQLSSRWIGLVTPLPVGLAKPLVDSLVNEVVADTSAIDELLPRTCMPVDEAMRLALRRVQDLAVPSSWTDAELARPGLVARREQGGDAYGEPGIDVAEPQPHDPSWAGGTINEDEQTVVADAPVAELFRAVTALGGERGWLAADVLWDVRGLIDVAMGGVGTRRGRRHPHDLAVGDALDFWRVEALDKDRRLLLRAEMKVPGEAWLEFRTSDLGDGRSLLEQRARFRPRGLWGRAYWSTMVPFHLFIFPVMARRLARLAEEWAAGNDGADIGREQTVKGA